MRLVVHMDSARHSCALSSASVFCRIRGYLIRAARGCRMRFSLFSQSGSHPILAATAIVVSLLEA